MVGLADGGAGPARERPRSASTFAAPSPRFPSSVGTSCTCSARRSRRAIRARSFLFQLGAIIVLSIALGITPLRVPRRHGAPAPLDRHPVEETERCPRAGRQGDRAGEAGRLARSPGRRPEASPRRRSRSWRPTKSHDRGQARSDHSLVDN
jgi:hypothetical protein